MSNFQNIPFDKIVRLGQKTLLDTDLFTVSWILARFCNYNCSYCWPYARSSIPDHRSLQTYCDTVDEIKRQARNNGYKNFQFSFSGGEPNAYKHLLKLIKHYADEPDSEYQSIHMTTNLSPGDKWWKEWLRSTSNLQRRSITASFHAEFANEQEFGEKCLQLIQQGVLLTINQVMVSELFDEYYDRCARFAEKGINVTLKPQSDPTASFIVEDYTQAQIDKMQTGFPQHINGEQAAQISLEDEQGVWYDFDQAERLNAFDFNKFKGWICNAGYQGIVVRENEVKRSYSCYDKTIGTLTEGFSIFDTPRKCITPTCISSADSKLPKIYDYRNRN